MTRSDLSSEQLKALVNLPGEELLIAKRNHWVTLVWEVSLSCLLAFMLVGLSTYVVALFSETGVLDFYLALLVYSILINVIVNRVILWYFHFYVITNRKILEVNAVPFQADTINDVFLDQVRTTEIDIKIHSFFQELFNMGDISLTFDAPSHNSAFVLKNIHYPRKVGIYLADHLEEIMNPSNNWFKRGRRPEHIKYSDDLDRKGGVGELYYVH